MAYETSHRWRAMLIFWFCAFAMLWFISTARSTSVLAATDACPRPIIFESSNDRDYVVVLGTTAPETTRVEMTLYAQNASFELAKNNVALETRSESDGSMAFRSSPLIVSNPGRDRFLAAAIRFLPSGRTASCMPVHFIIPTPESTRKRDFAGAERSLRNAVATELKGAKMVIVPEVAASVPPTCTNPFRDAAIDRVFEPEYPPGARAADAKGIVKVTVTLDATGLVTATKLLRSSQNGALDDATLNAARRTTYQPSVFLCKPEAGTYLFEADFTGAAAAN